MNNDHLNSLCLNLVDHLKQNKFIFNVQANAFDPVSISVILRWEEQHMCILPDDIKSFYQSTDGIDIKWSVKFDELANEIGHLHIRQLENVCHITGRLKNDGVTIEDFIDNHIEEECGESPSKVPPTFNEHSRIFCLDSCDGWGKICLVYKQTERGCTAQSLPEIWFLDKSLKWHFMAENFTVYFRLMVMHLGIKEWQFGFTDYGYSLQTKQWLNLFAPVRLAFRNEDHVSKQLPIHFNRFDSQKVIKGKVRDNVASNQPKKKQSVQTAKTSHSARQYRS